MAQTHRTNTHTQKQKNEILNIVLLTNAVTKVSFRYPSWGTWLGPDLIQGSRVTNFHSTVTTSPSSPSLFPFPSLIIIIIIIIIIIVIIIIIIIIIVIIITACRKCFLWFPGQFPGTEVLDDYLFQ